MHDDPDNTDPVKDWEVWNLTADTEWGGWRPAFKWSSASRSDAINAATATWGLKPGTYTIAVRDGSDSELQVNRVAVMGVSSITQVKGKV